MLRYVKTVLLILIILVCAINLNKTLAYYNTNTNHLNIFHTEKYTFSIDGMGGAFKKENVVIKENKVSLPSPKRNGYEFVGYSSSDNGEVEYTNHIDDVGKINNKKLYAKWEIINYSIKYNLNDGSLLNQKTSYTVEENFTLPHPEKRGYDFIGWTGTDLSSITKNVTIPKGTVGDRNYTANWNVTNYSISYNLNGGNISNEKTSYNVNDSFTLPIPTKVGYTFTGWSGTGIDGISKNVSISNSIGNKSFTANWSKNYYTVNYYVNGSLWAQRTVGYGDSLENLNAQSALDIYHTFHGWNNWVNTMPNHNVDLVANITESYCSLITGHGPYGNAEALLRVFQSAGWSGRIIEASTAPGYYMVVTDYNLTRAQAEIQKNYIAEHTNYTNYNFPYLYWVSVSCTNGYSEAWTRSLGQRYFN